MVVRIDPQFGPEHYKTYAIVAPRSTHTRAATCKEVECPAYRNGWKTIVPTDSPQAAYIRSDRERRHTESSAGAGLAEFRFPPEQRCFKSSEHRVSLEREPVYLVQGGDYRGNPRGTEPVRHKRPENWVEDFATHQQGVADARERG